MKKEMRFIACCLAIGLMAAFTVGTAACSPTPASTTASTLTSPAVTTAAQGNTTAPSIPAAQTGSSAQNAAVNLPSFADLLAVAELSVVEIDTSGTTVTSRGRTVMQQGAGSGWILDPAGTIVTNNHVIEGATTITVTTFDGKTFPAQVLSADPVNDLALIKINAGQLQSINVGDASKLRTGDWVLALGNPLGEGIIATQGIVSRKGVSVQVSSTQTYNNLIETTAAINPGNSGGPLIILAGEVIGITSLGVSAAGIEGMGYAINMVDALPAIQKLSGK
jgi:serine protease Do